MFTYSSIGWYTGFLALFCSVLNQGRRVICRQKFSPKNFGRIVKQYKVTNTITSTENATLLYQSADFHEDDFKSIKEFICGGERVPQSIRRHLAAKLPKGSFAVVYGATEAGIFTTFLKNVDFSGVRGSIVGRVRENVQCKVVEISSRKPLGPCEIGEILTIPEAHFNVSLKFFVEHFFRSFFSRRNIMEGPSKPNQLFRMGGTRPATSGTLTRMASSMFSVGRLT